MKIPLTYGALIAIASSVLTLLLFFLGYHSDAAKLSSAHTVATVVAIAIGVTGIVLGIRAGRAQYPADRPFGYGRALGVGVLIGVFGALFGSLFTVLYSAVINPDFPDVLLQLQVTQLEAKGMSSDQIDKATSMMRMMFRPAVQGIFSFFLVTIFNVAISLVAAAFLRRPATVQVAAPPLPSA